MVTSGMAVYTLSIQFAVIMYNPVGRPVTEVVHFPVNEENFEVLAFASLPIESQVLGNRFIVELL